MKKLMLGNEAVARGAYEAGVTVVSSYPGTPSTEVTEVIAKEYKDIYSEWACNEKVASEVAIGASFGGARSMTAMKHVGLNVAADPLYTASYTGVNGGLVAVDEHKAKRYLGLAASKGTDEDKAVYEQFMASRPKKAE